MIHELRMYTVRPGTLHKVLEASSTVGARIRNGATYGRLEGHWGSEIGPLNQYVHLWSYNSLSEMQRLRAELGALEAWREEYVPLIRPHPMSSKPDARRSTRNASPVAWNVTNASSRVLTRSSFIPDRSPKVHNAAEIPSASVVAFIAVTVP